MALYGEQELALELLPLRRARGVPLVDAAAMVGLDWCQRGDDAHPTTGHDLVQAVSLHVEAPGVEQT